MKKILTLLLVMTMILSVPFSKSVNATVLENTENSALELLGKIGVIELSNDAMAENIVTREDFALYLANLLGVDTNLEATQRYFSDVAMTAYGAKAIESLTELGIISRPADDKFRPDDNIALEEAVKMLCQAMGYGEYSNVRGGYPMGYLKTARECGFLISVADEKAIKVKEIARLIFEASQVGMYEPVIIGNDSMEYTASSKNTLLSLYHDIYFDEGTVNGVSGRTINFDTPPEDGIMYIDGMQFYADEDVENSEYLGEYVKYFYRYKSTDKLPRVIYLAKTKTENVKFEISNFVSFDYDEITYFASDESSKEQREKLEDAVIVYNGYPVDKDITRLFDELNKGFISLKDSDNDKIFDLIVIDNYETVVASGVDKDKMLIYSETGNGNYLDCKGYNNVKIYDGNMNPLEIDEIKAENVLSVAKTYNSNEHITIIVSSIVVNGTLDFVKSGKTTVAKINGVEYTVDKKYAEDFKAEVKNGNSYYYGCDFMNEIAFVSAEVSKSMSYAYVIDTTYIKDGFDEKVLVKVLDPNGKITDIAFAKNIKIDGRRYKNEPKKAQSAFLALGGGELKATMMRYTLDAEGNFKEIDTPFLNEPYENDRSSLTPIYGYTDDFSVKYYRDYRIGLRAYMTADTPVYCVPYDPVYGEIEQSEVMVQPLKTNLVMRIDAYYPSNAYTTNVMNEFADVVAVRYKYSVLPANAYDKTFVLVDEIHESVNQNGDVVNVLCGYTRGARVEYELDSRIEIGDVEQGDLVQLNYDVWGKIMPSYTAGQPDIVVLYDYSLWQGKRPDSSTGVWQGIVDGGRCYLYNGSADSQYYNNATQLSFGFANECVGNTVRFGYNSGSDFDEAFRVSGISVIVYDASKKEEERVYVGSLNDVVGYKSVGDECSAILVQTSHTSAKQLVVYK